MSSDSKYFDSIRINKRGKRGAGRGGTASAKAEPKICEWEGCTAKAEFRAPKGRGQEGQYHHFCQEHVREYNKSYNYFSGMSDSESWDYQRAANNGERPTWTMGVNAWTPNGRRRIFANGTTPPPRYGAKAGDGFGDPFGMFEGAGQGAEPPRQRHVRSLERRSLETLGLDDAATAEDIKSRYKELVKKHHPDANGGDRGSEDRLRDIIQAYKHLKSVGMC